MTVSTKTLGQTTVFNVDHNNKKIIEQKISILERFLNDHVTLKTENSALASQE